ncbi:MAG: hypothetical protein L0H53_16070 [Candidatus Nitrosocosmicus sp.]|nr:hypothetical protein [Candidatus Nitrosocosmicus sp.]MDN5869037.1 hypothetical protein [Candidatus Nitrosocosmicus sp.]
MTTSNENSPFDWAVKKIIENRDITYPMYCNLIDITAEYLKQQGKIWFDTQTSLMNNQKQIVVTNPLWYYNPYYPDIFNFTRKQSN